MAFDDNFYGDDTNEGSDDFHVKPEDFADIFVIPSDWTVSTLRQEMKDIIDLDPDFQRRSVWNIKSKSKFIESLALGIPIPQILLAESQESRNNYLVLDGKQRLLTIKEFFDGVLSDGKRFILEGLTDLPEMNDKDWQRIADQHGRLARSIEGALIRTAIIRGWRNDNVLYEIFHRLNAGSVRLSPMELRMSLIRGPFIKEVIRQSGELRPLQKMLNLAAPDKRMKDVEVAIRHMAFSDPSFTYRGNLKDFLDDYCKAHNRNFDRFDLDDKLEQLSNAIDVGLRAFPEKSFARKYMSEASKFEPSFNRAVFDVLAGSLNDEGLRKQVEQNPDKFVVLFKQVCENSDFRKAVETTTKSVESTRTRFQIWYNLLNSQYDTALTIPKISDARNKS
ncbi:DUF262 domain-containing protein [Agrobacterium tumefaciens]|uniref:DUF262 domain-containing protein n=1 Tax=Agrobacterium tumefaciens TaxID=358 RepID=UPI0021D02142|nr:DUF262 domain-containing protein [Agrobacterium tumefaciens]UXT19744.1 DUF262 domain-containing protein [Agrobacterium tumefaciens]